jgi:hypothetical protein
MTMLSHWTQKTMAKSGAEELELLVPLVVEAHGMEEVARQGGRREMAMARIEVPGELLETEMDEEAENQQADNANQNRL